jgi:predicted transcriptional regulator
MQPPSKTPLGFGPTEQAVMDALWRASPHRWLTFRSVRSLMDRSRPAKQVGQVLAILCEKGHAERRRPAEGSHWVYRATQARHDYLTSMIMVILAYSPDPHGVLRQVRQEFTAAQTASGGRGAG